MAKRAPMSVSDLSEKAQSPESQNKSVAKEEKDQNRGRPKKTPDDFKTMSVRVSPSIQKALRQASLNHDKPIQEIMTDGILDQLARLGVIVQD